MDTEEKYLNMCKLIMCEIRGPNGENIQIREARYKIFYDRLINKTELWLDNFYLLYTRFKKNNDDKYLEKSDGVNYTDDEMLAIIELMNENMYDIRIEWRLKEAEIEKRNLMKIAGLIAIVCVLGSYYIFSKIFI